MSLYLLDDDDPRFPPARLASPDEDGILAVGGDYSVPRLLEAYAGGIFPWSTNVRSQRNDSKVMVASPSPSV